MLKYIFICVTLITVVLGVKTFWDTSTTLVSYKNKSNDIFQEIQMQHIKILESKYVTFSTSKRSLVSICFLNNKKLAIFDLPNNKTSILVKRKSKFDNIISQKFSKNIEAFEVVQNIFLYFFKEYIISLFLIVFGLFFLFGAYCLFRDERNIKSEESQLHC